MRVAFFQRFFAHYQWGLVEELAHRSNHEYCFFGDDHDPANSGIAPISSERLRTVDHRVVRTWQPGIHFAFQPYAVWMGLLGRFDAFILEGSFLHPTAWAAMLAAQARGKRVLLYTHGWKRHDTSAFVRSLRGAFMRRADGLLLYGYKAKAIGISLGLKPENMYVVFNSLDYRHMVTSRDAIDQIARSNIRTQLFGDGQIPMAIYVGRLVSSKHVDLLIEACSLVAGSGRRFGLVIVGDGPEMSSLKARASQSHVPVHFTGSIYEEQILSLLISASNVLVVPGPLGLSGIHAMTYGTPVITDDGWDFHGPEAEAVIPGKTGAIFHKGDPNSLASVLLSFLNDSQIHSTYYKHCVTMVDQFYSPAYMRQVFDKAVAGEPVDELHSYQTVVDSVGTQDAAVTIQGE